MAYFRLAGLALYLAVCLGGLAVAGHVANTAGPRLCSQEYVAGEWITTCKL